MMDAVHQFEFTVPAGAVDVNGHVNNVTYVQWMQEAAIRHADATGGTRLAEAIGAIWVVRTHQVEYLRPAFAGDKFLVMTWVSDFRKVRSLRKYKFIRASDRATLVQAQTDWVFVNATTGRPQAIPDDIRQAFKTVGKDQEPN